MAVIVKEKESQVTAPKRVITVKGVKVADLKLVDETGDVTSKVLDAIPDEFTEIDVKITLELPSDEVGEDV